jgi:thiosulfate reductase cytochrome b subunit
MKSRIVIWAAGGALIVGLWSVFLSGAPGTPRGLVAILLDLTCPIALARQHHMTVDFVVLANALTYALAGLALETMWRTTKPSH